MDFNYRRRRTRNVKVGNTAIGGDNPVRLQSMTNTSTMDTQGSVAQVQRIVDAGADIVRLTAQGIREAENLGCIRAELRSSGCDVPLVADIHFNPKAAFAAAAQVE
ncbi:MAG: flavodoxin-dependent (E)-4-hydroxy-3-methylbut-2-enyl-diphosphate synthase, partial [Muribaculaceae bacterium]|nr:flavodoxin-dependent (E)-4-hydroxy-3-methylbut-2-enyl-diphosphate synthase [Muribaculaceae bacterium]